MNISSQDLNLSEYSKVCYDSRQIEPRAIFVCIKGEQVDGHDYIEVAIDKGASLVVYETESLARKKLSSLESKYEQVQFLGVEDSRFELAQISARFYKNPSQKLKAIAVTGTNGKTTVAHLVQSILAFNNHACATLGTMGLKESPSAQYVETGNTTPQSTDIQKLFADLLAKDFEYTSMEVSSHALDQKRVAGINFAGGAVTNITQDHLDYHRTMENYCEAKVKLINQLSKYVVLNLDDAYHQDFLIKAERRRESLKKESKEFLIINTAVENQAAHLLASNIEYSNDGLSFDLSANAEFVLNFQSQVGTAISLGSTQRTRLGSFKLKLNGLFNVYNTLSAIAIAFCEGLNIGQIQEALFNTAPVGGRFETIKNAKSPLCIVDYAHSPDGLDNILRGARALLEARKEKGSAKLICLFGCGGNRDITKRPKMGKIAYNLADFVYVTSDNPRAEDPDQIIADILTGIPNLDKVKVIPDRALAIKESILNSKTEDIVVIAGKGHENYQILNTGTIHFDDREQVERLILTLAD